ncbi:MAG: ATPase [Bdellovibrionales bacterium RIFOXYD12_FULL_39_22]|nr:MAG: ATPase [Bdellovibrionales bacterium RIFOXYB1_FULL_39_21]OFZ42540.1 MAG: ATPase [Bdellovibrionales bacterium RIFOXYC12_FULL_39_17]OFZ45819.1 MAG: ATPase [Bdellovibrionales bacterium RIFOXYC1_FULL_39_130]OFZ72098.1 MAG: ATPase [Bdellovibrionales bacterium RIFOXYC2_FULL_39_8]OFZ74752.1 MAG: ATPase [Bdellovibrionales bacterium RIFOXYD1_FULL_39_84]OFZ93131.1 MAG: ATPase [Bdellovibrionales bacterium RIFOXYD12_FULL_39_22]HLE12133.1 ATP-binding protein [Bacteriovoracaceae bacterium]
MKRYLAIPILKDLPNKIVLLSGPRQSGKTTLSKMLFTNYEYLNYDHGHHRTRIEKKDWDRKTPLVILDELHKMSQWKRWLKGIFDVEGIPPSLLVTGSAKLDTYRKVGDSLAGRFFAFRLHPLDLKELKNFSPDDNKFDLQKSFETLLQIGGFPGPYLEGSMAYYKRWRNSHLDIIVRQDLITLERVTNITGIENLIRLLRNRVGSTISHNNLANDLGIDPKTVKNWLDILERLYVIFKVTPFSKKIKDSILKAPKYYFYDNGQVEGDNGVKLENLVACALLKELHFIHDIYGEDVELNFLRTKRGEEIDFLVSINRKPMMMIEVKWAEDSISKGFYLFEKFIPNIPKIQLVGMLKREISLGPLTEIRAAAKWLSNMSLWDGGQQLK